MIQVCVNCGSLIRPGVSCAGCRSRCQMTEPNPGATGPGNLEARWQHTPVGRIVVGLLLAQGLAHGLRLFFNAGLLAAADSSLDIWDAAGRLTVFLTLQGICLLLAGAMAGAGQHAGVLIGTVVGALNSLLMLVVQRLAGEQLTGTLLLVQPAANILCGAIGGWIGSTIWKPLPAVTLAAAPEKQKTRPRTSPGLFAGPVAWFRVLLGSAVVVPGVVWCVPIVTYLIDRAGQQVHVATHTDFRILLWEFSGLAILLGSALAGVNTRNGAKQGLCVGIISSVLITGIQLGQARLPVEHVFSIGVCVLVVSILGGWFGSRVLPPVLSIRPRRLSNL